MLLDYDYVAHSSLKAGKWPVQLMRREPHADEEDAREGSLVFVERRCLIEVAKPAAKELRLSRHRYGHASQTVIASLTYDVIARTTSVAIIVFSPDRFAAILATLDQWMRYSLVR